MRVRVGKQVKHSDSCGDVGNSLYVLRDVIHNRKPERSQRVPAEELQGVTVYLIL